MARAKEHGGDGVGKDTMMSSMTVSARVLLTLLFAAPLVGASCGPAPSPEGGETETEGETAGTTEAPTPEQGRDTASADAVPLSALPETEGLEIPERTAPTITTLDQAREALNQGFYAEVGTALARTGAEAIGRGPALELLQAQHLFVTGGYDDAAAKARLAVQHATRGAAADPAIRIAAQTLLGEVLVARGRWDDAQAAFEIVKDEPAAHRARVMLGRLLNLRGQRVAAEPILMKLIAAFNDGTIGDRDAEGLSYVGMAAWELGAPRDANDAFVQSVRAESGARPPSPPRQPNSTGGLAAPPPPPTPAGRVRVETRLEWARLFLAKYDAGHAEENIREVFEVNPVHPEAHALLARIKIAQSFNFAAAEAHVEQALSVNPNLGMAHITRAGMALRDLDIDAADASLDRALQTNPNDMEALSTRAAVRYLADDDAGFAAAKREVFRRNRTYTELYAVLGEFAEWEHRYPDIVAMSREAVTLDSNDYRAHAALGLNLLRMGDEAEGLTALQSAWRRDRFNVRVFNTLNLYDDVIEQEYEELTDGPFVFRMHRDERSVLERYVPRTLRRAYTDMVRRYQFTPEGPVRIELFANTSHFSVRTVGLPNLGVQGVCFGKVVTAISPRGGPFNWGQITWHELAHVFHIQLSRNRVPRWFTEGLAEYETLIARQDWQREMDHHLWAALEEDRLPPLRLMNRAFTRARSGMDMMVAYYASTRIVKYIADEHGFPDVVAMLRGWSQGKTTPEVVQTALGITIEELDRNFRAHARQRLRARADDFSVDFSQYTEVEPIRQAAEAAPTDASKQGALAAALLVGGDAEAAQAAAARAIGIDAAEPVARFVLARLALMQSDGQTALTHLQALLAGGRDGYELRLLMARAALGGNDTAAARQSLEAAARIDEHRPEAWMGLSEIAQQANDADLRLRALSRLARIDEHDRPTHAALLALLVERAQWDDAVTEGEASVFVDPNNPAVHDLLAQAYLQKGRHAEALYEADTALLVQHPEPGRIQLMRARAFVGLRRRADARTAAQAAEAADPNLAEEARGIVGGR